MAGGIAVGALLPAPFQALGRATVAQINIPIAILVWLMIVPMLMRIDPAALRGPQSLDDASQKGRFAADQVGTPGRVDPDAVRRGRRRQRRKAQAPAANSPSALVSPSRSAGSTHRSGTIAWA